MDESNKKGSEEFYRNILNNLMCGVVVCSFDGDIIKYEYCNNRYWEMLGKTNSNYEGTSMLERVKDNDVFILLGEIRSAIWERRDISCNIQLLCSDAKYRAIHIEGSISNYENGRHRMSLLCTKADEKVMSFQEMLPMALYSMMSAVSDSNFCFFKDKNMRYISCSKYGIEHLDLKNPLEIIGKSDYDLFPKEVADIFYQAGYRVMETGECTVDEEMSLPSSDSSIHIFKNSIYPVRDFNDQIIGLYGVGQDVTEQTRREFQLQLLTQGVPGGLTSFYVENGKMTPVFFNDGFFELFGLPKEDFKNYTIEEQKRLIHEEDSPLFMY